MSLPGTDKNMSAIWYGFDPCCGGPIVYFKYDGTTNPPTQGINVYDGPPAIGYNPLTGTYVPLTNQCYRIFSGTILTISSAITASNYGNLQVVPTNFGSNYTYATGTANDSQCTQVPANFCPDCVPQCYTLWSCDGSQPAFTTDTDLSLYVNTSVLIQAGTDPDFNCYYVTPATSCFNPIPVAVDPDIPCTDPCSCQCYEIIGNAKLDYVDCNGTPISTQVNGYFKDCSLVYPVTSPSPGPNLTIINHGDCVDGMCPQDCYELIDCAGIENPIYTTAQSLSPYASLGQVVIIDGYTNCWIVNQVVDCDCAIDVVVTQAFADCATCTAGPNYILSNCDDLNTIIYTSDDLSAYVDQVVQLGPDCPGCWIVDAYPNPIPSDVAVTITVAFQDCDACKTTYYELTDCNGIEPSIITFTDLSAYVTQVITLAWCPTTCWRVSIAITSVGAGLLGDIQDEFDTCIDCLTSFPCICSRVKNHDTVSHNYDYLDCDGTVQTITLLSGERSERICMAHWLTSYPTDYVEYFGDCTLNTDIYECPPQIYPKRSVQPGYVAPICSTEKYEKITCKSAEILYKSVLELRYGISNCCPEEDDKWLIKKQLIDLEALRDPAYVCQVNTCNCPPSTCGCGCGTTPKTCNSN